MSDDCLSGNFSVLPAKVAKAAKVCSGGPRWQTAPQPDLEATIAAFKAEFPGWWYSVCECQLSCDASCAPTSESPDIALIVESGDQFDDGFHADLPQPVTLAEALLDVMAQARAARLIAQAGEGA